MAKAKRKAAAAKPPATAAADAATGIDAAIGGASATGEAARMGATRGIAEGRVRAVIDAVLPVVGCGRFPIKRIAGEPVEIEAHCFTDGHDKVHVVLQWQSVGASDEYEVEMRPQPNDVWIAEFTPPRAGRYRYTVMAWVDPFESWRRELERREDPADVRMALRVGSALIDEVAIRAAGSDGSILAEWSAQLRNAAEDA